MNDEAQIVFPTENGRKQKKKHHLNLSEHLKNLINFFLAGSKFHISYTHQLMLLG